MSIVSSILADHHNEWVRRRAVELRDVLNLRPSSTSSSSCGGPVVLNLTATDAAKLQDILARMEKGPFSE